MNFCLLLKIWVKVLVKVWVVTETTGNLICNKIANKITKVSKNLQQNSLETVTNEHGKEIPKERYISIMEYQKGTSFLDNTLLP